MTTKRRTIFKLSAFLLLGAAFNVAVAWVCAFGLAPRFGQSGLPDSVRVVTAVEFKTLLLRSFPDLTPEGGGEYGITQSRFGGGSHRLLWMSGDHSRSVEVHRTTAGWPARSVYGQDDVDERSGALKWRSCGTIHLSHLDLRVQGSQLRIGFLPCQPIGPGFAINTVFYAGVCWLLFAAPFAVRRRRRIKRGLCPACAYPAGTSEVCTECGKPVRVPPCR